MAKIWDFDTINREVPIEEVLALHGIMPSTKMRGQGWYSIRQDDDTPSAHIDAQRRFGNTIHDFGYGNTFNPLTLTMFLQGCDMKTASQILGEAFNIPPVNVGRDEVDSKRLSDYEWKMIGVYPDMASKNIDFDLEKYGIQSTMKLSEKFRLSMSELQGKVLGLDGCGKADDIERRRYESILRSRAVPYVMESRYEYFRRMHDIYTLYKEINPALSDVSIFNTRAAEYEEFAKSLVKMETTLKKAIAGTSIKFTSRNYVPMKDFAGVVNGDLAFEIGAYSHYEVSAAAYREYAKIIYCIVSLAEYYKLFENGMHDLRVAARQKGDQVTLSFVSSDAAKMNYLFKALRGKEAVLSSTIDGAIENYKTESNEVAKGKDGVPTK